MRRVRVAWGGIGLHHARNRPSVSRIQAGFFVRKFCVCGKNGGEEEIRTLETCYSLPAFQASAFNHSATSPHIPVFTGNLMKRAGVAVATVPRMLA